MSDINYIEMDQIIGKRLGFAFIPKASFQHVVTQSKVDKIKTKYIAEDVEYLTEHPEVGYIVELLTTEILINRPKSVTKFASDLFNRPDIRELIYNRSKFKKDEKLPTDNWNLKPYKITDWNNVPQINMGESDDDICFGSTSQIGDDVKTDDNDSNIVENEEEEDDEDESEIIFEEKKSVVRNRLSSMKTSNKLLVQNIINDYLMGYVEKTIEDNINSESVKLIKTEDYENYRYVERINLEEF